MLPTSGRRELKTRRRPLARALATRLATAGVSANQVSIVGVAAAAGGAAALVLAPHAGRAGAIGLLLGAVVLVQLRLLCNMLDGLVAVELGRHTYNGALFNEVPDRLEDSLLLVAAGYASTGWQSWSAGLGWAAALTAMMTAYIRVLGGSLGQTQDFCGPLAKQHRMAVFSVALVAAAVETGVTGQDDVVLVVALGLIAAGAAATCLRRLVRIDRRLPR